MKKSVIILIVGLVVFFLGVYQNYQYEEQSLKVKATITDIETEDDDDGGYKHTYYGKYEVDGKTYKNKKLQTRYDNSYMPDKSVGDTIKITVDPENPNRKVAEGGIFGVVGLIMTVCGIVMVVKDKKAKEKTPC